MKAFPKDRACTSVASPRVEVDGSAFPNEFALVLNIFQSRPRQGETKDGEVVQTPSHKGCDIRYSILVLHVSPRSRTIGADNGFLCRFLDVWAPSKRADGPGQSVGQSVQAAGDH